ncbi:MAG: YceI family protein [Bacteroidia bacterium]|nr:YceI family protein [Bacteroidia bacterium]
MKAVRMIPLLFLAFAFTASAQTRWTFDKSHTNIGFNVTHLVISEVDGFFKTFDGSITTKGDSFDNATIEFSVDIASIDTDNEKRDQHLKSDDFFNAEKYPKMTFKSTSMKKSGKNTYKLIGDLTIRDKTKRVELDVRHNGTVQDPWGNTKAGFKITGKINRFDYDLKWNTLTEAGGAVVGKDVRLNLNVQLKKEA